LAAAQSLVGIRANIHVELNASAASLTGGRSAMSVADQGWLESKRQSRNAS